MMIVHLVRKDGYKTFCNKTRWKCGQNESIEGLKLSLKYVIECHLESDDKGCPKCIQIAEKELSK